MSIWISTEFMKPDDLQQIDILINGKRRIVDITYNNGKFYAFPPVCKDQWTEIKNNVTHWMSIPEPPKE